ncbi:MAG: hypothetical protein JWO38_3552 [Gemmataceae bacterium]|nr:hypothetical protein [Gemmataceae bacterium]
MPTPFERVKAAWDSVDRRAELNRVVEMMAAEGVTLDALDAALDQLLMEVRAAGADDDTEEIIMGVGDRLHGWSHVSRHIKTQPAKLPTEEEIAKLPRWARVAFAARCARRVLPLFNHSVPNARDRHLSAVVRAVDLAEQGASSTDSKDFTYGAVASEAFIASTAVANKVARATARAANAAASSCASVDNAAAVVAATLAACEADSRTLPMIVRDFQAILGLARAGNWTDDTPVPPSVFGPMWPDGQPTGWPKVINAGDVAAAVDGVTVTSTASVIALEPPDIDPLIDVYFAEGEFSAEEMQLFLDYLAANYRDLGGTGLKVVEGQTLVPAEAEVPR